MARKKEEVSEEQYEVLELIMETLTNNCYQPSRQEMADKLGITKQAVDGRLAGLQRLGLITIQPRKERAIILNGITLEMTRSDPKP